MELAAQSVSKGMGVVTESGALAIETGEFTGRSPKDRFIVLDEKTRDTVWWGDINLEFDAEKSITALSARTETMTLEMPDEPYIMELISALEKETGHINRNKLKHQKSE